MAIEDDVLRILMATEEEGPSLKEKRAVLRPLLGNPAAAERLIFQLAERSRTLEAHVSQAREQIHQVGEVIECLTAPPLYPAILLRVLEDGLPIRAVVAQGGGRRVAVTIAPEIDPSRLRVGDEVYLSREANCILSLGGRMRSGEMASFDRYMADGRLVLRLRDEEIVVEAAGGLDHTLRPGDQLLVSRDNFLAMERLERSDGSHLLLEGTPQETFEQIGGLDKEIRQLLQAVEFHLCRPDLARKYRLARKRGICLKGPPGCGKTLMARALANHLARSGKGKSWFMNVKPGAMSSMWHGRSEENWRELFRVARETALQSGFPVIVFLDEIDSTGKARGGVVSEIEDRILNSLLAELDGLEGRGDVLVIGATNRFELLDEALVRPGRLGDLVLEIGRPRRNAAREIFRRHLAREIPYWTNGVGPEESRDAMIEAALSFIYAPGGEAGRLAMLVYRDGKRQEVRAADIISGAIIAKICAVARERAAFRELEGGEPGLQAPDLLLALGEEFRALAQTFQPHNIRGYLYTNLRQDVDVVAVEPAAHTGPSYRYLRE